MDYRPSPIGEIMEEEIERAFNEYLGTPFEEMDRMGQSMYRPDFELFEAGFKAAMGWLTKSSSGSSTTA